MQGHGYHAPFKQLYFVDANPKKVEHLQKIIDGSHSNQKSNAQVICGDCNEVLPKQIFPSIVSDSKKRAICLLDPYGMHVTWDVIKQAGASKKMDVFINFSTMDINMNALTRYKETAKNEGIERFTALWGDNS